MKTKRCFIIMPISDNENYSTGHFGRVYEHIIKPACDIAGFVPIRADDIMTTNYIALDVVKNIIECEMAICDLSSRNPNVLYELGIRQAFNLPVTLIKDRKTNRIFDIQGFRDVEYDESLRIDNVEEIIQTLAETIKNTYENTNEINSLVSLLGIEPAKVTNKKEISPDTEILLNTLQGLDKRMAEMERRIISQESPSKIKTQIAVDIPDNVGRILDVEEIEKLNIGDRIYQSRFGEGEVVGVKITANPGNCLVQIKFQTGEYKTFVAKYTMLYRII